MANNIISRLMVSLGLDNSKFKSGLSKSEKETKSFGKTVNKIGGAIAAAFSVAAIGKFIVSVTKLAGEAEGVEKAFNRIADSNTLSQLQSATRGTVSNLELMRKAVMAQNLGVPVKELGNLFAFASQRAADTGESVDFLVSSIVTGIGRKSPLILDNLGISAIALKDKLDGVGLGTASVADVTRAVASIANDELKKAGDTAKTSGQTIQSMSAAWDNVRLSLGKVVASSDTLFKLISGIELKLNSIGLDKFERNFLNLTSQIDEETDKIINKDIEVQVSDRSEKRLELLNTALVNTQKNIEQHNARVLELEKFHNARGLDDAKKTLEEERKFAQRIRAEILKERDASETRSLAKRFNINSKSLEDLKKLEKSFSSFTFGENKRRADLILPLIKQQIAEREKESGTIKELSQELELLKGQQEGLTGSALINTNKRIKALEKEIKTLKDLRFEAGEIEPIELDVSVKPITDQPIQLPKEDIPELPMKITTEGTFADSDAFIATQQHYQNQLGETQRQLEATGMVAQQYGSILGSVGQIAAASGDSQIASILSVAAATIQAVSQIIPVLFASSTAKAAEAGAAVPFPGNIAAIAAGVAAVASVFSGLGGGSVSSTGASVTSIDTRGFTSPTTDATRRTTTAQQSIRVEVEGRIDNKTIALSNKKGTKELQR